MKYHVKKMLAILILIASINTLFAQATIETLDSVAAFSFSIMSDNKGYSVENPHMYNCDKWIKEAGDKFIIGLGDHVKDLWDNPFLDLLKTDSLWHNHFYPNVADGENEFWGQHQGDWGSGKPILDFVDLSNRKNVKIRENGCEYYAIEEHEGIRVHIIQLHFSDNPLDPAIAFNESSREYLMDVLNGIHKSIDNDIIVVLAHTGAWVDLLSEERKIKLLNKADIVLGATTHVFKRYHFLGMDVDTGAIALNTGAVGNSFDSGFLQIHVLKNPTRMFIQYQHTKNESRELNREGFAFEKVINGRTREIDLNLIKVKAIK